MKTSIRRERIIFYSWVAFAYLLLWLVGDLITYPGPFGIRVLNNIWSAAYILIVNYVFFEYSLPFIIRMRTVFSKFILFLFAVWVQLMLYSFGLYAWNHLGITIGLYIPFINFPLSSTELERNAGYGVGSLFFFAILKHFYEYRKLKEAEQRLRIEKQEAELNFLKSQTNPHFLFNTLNNIYSLSRDKSELAAESILRLSKILRFMLYETEDDYIAIEEELKIIADYIALEKLRYDESLRINFNYDIDDMKQPLPPLLLIPLVENAFKHGVSETSGEPYIDSHLSVNRQQLTFVVKNSSGGFTGESIKENIGLSNLRRQLRLLYTAYDLSVQQGDSEFTAVLKIDLQSQVVDATEN